MRNNQNVIWVEGVATGSVTLDLVLTNELLGIERRDTVVLTVLELENVIVHDQTHMAIAVDQTPKDFYIVQDDLTATATLDVFFEPQTFGEHGTGQYVCVTVVRSDGYTVLDTTCRDDHIFLNQTLVALETARDFTVTVWVDMNSNGAVDANEDHRTIIVHIVKIDILRNGENITNTTSTVIVGQHIELIGVLSHANINITEKHWIIPGSSGVSPTAIENYTQSTGEGIVTKLAVEDLDSDGIDFYWIDGGANLIVSYVVTIEGVEYSANATFNVHRPTATLSATLTTDDPKVNVGDIGDGKGLALHFGRLEPDPAHGITWNATVTAPAGGAGQIAFTQLINTDCHIMLDPSGTWQKWTSDGRFILDNGTNGRAGIQYFDPVSIQAGAQQDISRYDSPCLFLTPDIKQAIASDHFQVYLMYRPDGADSIWVTLRLLTWQWCGAASKDSQTGQWSLVGSSSYGYSTGDNSTILPQWSNCVSRLNWVDE